MYLLVRRKLLECFLIEPIRILNGQINFVGDGGGGKMGGGGCELPKAMPISPFIGTERDGRTATLYQWSVYEQWRMCETLDNVPVCAVSGLF
jgi:hypothetical protein